MICEKNKMELREIFKMSFERKVLREGMIEM